MTRRSHILRLYNVSLHFFSAGGIKLVNASRRITLDNSLDERLRLLEDRVSYLQFD